MATVEIRNVRKTYPGLSVEVIKGISAAVADGEFLVMLGPSGCGKSTLLRMVAGLETISAGEIAIGGRVVNALEPKDRDIAMVFQNYALYPHMSVYDNIAYGLRIRGLSKAAIDAKVQEAAALLELAPFLDRKPRALSGGQRQRVAMGRAIVREPAVFLFDEPLSNLDAKLRTQMRVEIKRLQARLGITSLYVTHDQVEAMTLADRLMVMNAGVAEQVGTPMEVYRRPAYDLRRRLHRLAGDEFPGRAHRIRWRCRRPARRRAARDRAAARRGRPRRHRRHPPGAPRLDHGRAAGLRAARDGGARRGARRRYAGAWEAGRGDASFCSPACPATPSCAPATASPSRCRPRSCTCSTRETGKALARLNRRPIKSARLDGSIGAAGPLTTWRSLAGRPAMIHAFIYVLAAARGCRARCRRRRTPPKPTTSSASAAPGRDRGPCSGMRPRSPIASAAA